MPKQPNPISEVRALLASYRHQEAEHLIKAALESDPKNPSLWAELGLVYSYTQREVQAAELLEKAWGGEREPLLAQMLVDYFECRRQMARKLQAKDEIGNRLRKHIKALTGKTPGDVGITLSACLIVKNEEANLDRCLSALKSLADEIVVIDTGSTDRTVEIAKTHGAKVEHFEWCDDFAAARNASLEVATGKWALWIDADEELTPRSFSAIREGLIRPHFGGYFIQIVNFMDEQGQANQYVHTPIRLFRLLPEIRFIGRVHEQISPSITALGLPNATLDNALIHHYGYRPSEMDAKDKIQRTLDLLQRQITEEPDEPFHWFNLANLYSVAHDHEKAAEAAEGCISRMDDNNPFGSLTYQILQTALIELGKPEQAIARAEEATKRGYGGILVEFEKAHAYSRVGAFEDALNSINRCFEMEWPPSLTGDYGIVTHKRHLLKGQILAQMGRLDESLTCLDHCLGVDPANPAGLYTKGAVLEKKGQLDDAIILFEQALPSKGQGRAARKALGRCHLALGHFGEAKKWAEEAWRLKPEDNEPWQVWLSACEADGDLAGAIQAYEELLRLEPATAEMLVNQGRLLVAAGDPQAALNAFLEAMRLDPTSSNAFFNCGDLLYAAGQYGEAAEVYQTALRIEPSSAQGWFVLGNSFAQLGVLDGAVLGYEQALALDPNHAEARHNLDIFRGEAAAAA